MGCMLDAGRLKFCPWNRQWKGLWIWSGKDADAGDPGALLPVRIDVGPEGSVVWLCARHHHMFGLQSKVYLSLWTLQSLKKMELKMKSLPGLCLLIFLWLSSWIHSGFASLSRLRIWPFYFGWCQFKRRGVELTAAFCISHPVRHLRKQHFTSVVTLGLGIVHTSRPLMKQFAIDQNLDAF